MNSAFVWATEVLAALLDELSSEVSAMDTMW
jgi:hypothetical protein